LDYTKPRSGIMVATRGSDIAAIGKDVLTNRVAPVLVMPRPVTGFCAGNSRADERRIIRHCRSPGCHIVLARIRPFALASH
jgi:hypothetical protein